MSDPDAPLLTEAEMARLVKAGVEALDEEAEKEERKHYRGPGVIRRSEALK